MSTYYSTCVSGLEDVARAILLDYAPGTRVRQVMDGAIIYESSDIRPHLKKLRCFQNTYELVASRPRSQNLKDAVRWATGDRRALQLANQTIHRYRFKTFRVMFSSGNRLSSVAANARNAMERAITSAKPNRQNPDTELLLLWRNERVAYLMVRLPSRQNARVSQRKGELSEALAQCMVYLAAPRPKDVFLDPFCGYGALGKERAHMAAGQILLSDTDAEMVRYARAGLERFPRAKASVKQMDALQLSQSVEAQSVDELVTDPPWGIYEELPMDATEFYSAMLKEFAVVMKRRGRLVLLTAAKKEFETAMASLGIFQPMARYDVLVNGKKAAVYMAEKI